MLWNLIGDKNSMLLKTVLVADIDVDRKIRMVEWLVRNGTEELRDTCVYCAIVHDSIRPRSSRA